MANSLRLFCRVAVGFIEFRGWDARENRWEDTIWIADAHRDNGKMFVARNDEKLTAFLELERVTRESIYGYDAGRYPPGPTVIIE